MLLNQQVQGILYLVFESKSVLKVYIFKRSANGTNNTVKIGRHRQSAKTADWWMVNHVNEVDFRTATAYISYM